jgi:hypothetical protein
MMTRNTGIPPRTRRPLRRLAVRPWPAVVAVLIVALTGCLRGDPDVDLASLTPGERLYIERSVNLERARAVALVDRARGDALLDSLAAAWGDSARRDVLAGLPGDPVRATAVHRLLLDVIAAEQETLLAAPGVERLGLPLPVPVRPGEGGVAAAGAKRPTE